jgi:nucleotide-binding universal stress UspA family protein
MGFKKILVALDASPETQMVFEEALELAKKESASLMIFNGVDFGSKLTFPTEIKEKTKEGEELLQAYQKKAQEQGVTVESSCRVGEPGKAICNLAQSWNADLIILGRRGFRGFTEILLGSVSSHVLHNAPCSVLVLQGKAYNK